MRLRWLVLWATVSIVLQLIWPRGIEWYLIVPNFFLAFMVLSSVYTNTRHLLWVAFCGGLIFDLFAYQQFGFYMAFYILLALMLKLVWHFDRGDLKSASLLIASVVSSLLFFVLSHFALFNTAFIKSWGAILVIAGLEVAATTTVVAIAIAVIRLRQQGIIRD